MPAYGSRLPLNPYQTSYNHDYPAKVDWGVNAIRPMTSSGYATQIPYIQPPGPTTYDVEYHQKHQRPASPERAGTASGNRNNRPHPAQGFMVWKFPHKARSAHEPRVSSDLTNEKLNQITRRLCHSVYQNDYLGIPQGFQVKSAFNLPPDWKDNVGYDMDSNQRQSYQYPIQQSQLVVPTTRYGSNFKKPIASKAVVPTANKRLFGVSTRTTYDRHYNDNAGPVVDQIRDVGKKLGMEALKKHYTQTVGEDKDLIGKLLEEYGGTMSPLAGPAPGAPNPTYFTQPSNSRPPCPTPPPSSSRPGTAHRSPPASHRSSGPKSPGKRSESRGSNPAFKLRPSLPAATAIMLPSPVPNQPHPVTLPTSPPPSLPYTPPVFLA